MRSNRIPRGAHATPHAGAERSECNERRAAPGRSRRRAARLIFPILALLLTLGCQAPRTGRALPQELSGSDPDAQMNYWREMSDQPVTSNDEAFHGLLLFVDGKDDSTDYPARVTTLKSRKWLPKNFAEPAEEGIRRGVLAVAIMRVLNQRGGLTTRLFGPVPRYATRELMFLNVYPPSTPNQVLSGTEFVGIIGRVEDYQRGDPAAVPAATEAPAEVETPPPPVPTQPVRE